ncbi:MAG: PSD1 and planctomycete cytochrome C domain-containing protein [Phycisphaerales bacterium]|nr:PSD1 and planctomycete cytochrome C domain-containing protein [Phycisphaerales bacterium]
MSVFLILAAFLTAGAPFNPESAAEIRSLLASRCFACHGPDQEARKAGIRLDTAEGQQARHPSGAIVFPGHPDKSLLAQRIESHDPDLRMPPSGPPLDEEEIQLIRDWIRQGAQWPTHWAWKPIKNPAEPEVANTQWILDPLDSFILADLEAVEMEPAEQAEPSTWLRRVHYDLLGMPPSPDLIASFEQDAATDPIAARERMVDRLLDSPHFGEHWGRHWLDLVRYAETCGHEFDYPIPHAWRYRDWVIRAFNDDVAYDRFVIEHVAGDLVHDPRIDESTGLDDSLPATGFWFLNQGTHAPVDVQQDEADRMENQIDVFGKAFSGITLSCARCHDHKFDPIGTDEYYAIGSYLQSSRRRDAYLDPHGRIEAKLQQIENQKRAIARDLASGRSVADGSAPTASSSTLFETFDGSLEDWFPDGHAFGQPLETGEPYIEDEALFIAGSGQWHSGLRSYRAQGAIRSPSFTIENDWIHHHVKGRGARIRIYIDGFRLNEYNPLLFEDCLKQVDTPDWHHVAQRVGKYRGHVAWIEYSDDGDGWIAIDEIQASDNSAEPVWIGSPDKPVDGVDSEKLAAALETIIAEEQAIETPVRVLSMTDGTPEDQRVSLKGNHATPGPLAPRSSPSIMRSPTTVPPDGSGRLQLAESLVSRTNPLTSRVMVNRIWHYLLGQGLVVTVDDFGAMGRPPSHPELLDHLATRFQSHWSVKEMVRAIVLSRTYGMSSQANPQSLELDPNNRLIHHHPLKRITAESIRDAMLSVSGQLDSSVGGAPVATHLTDYMTGRGRPGNSGPLDGDGRRSIYLEVRRNFLPPLLTAFDMPTPSLTTGKRTVSNVPAQALTLMNDPFVHEQAKYWAERILLEHDSNQDRIRTMFMESFGRPPTQNELKASMAFIESGSKNADDVTLWMDLGHSLFNAKEFIYLD